MSSIDDFAPKSGILPTSVQCFDFKKLTWKCSLKLHETLPAKHKPIEKQSESAYQIIEDSKSEFLNFFLKLVTDVEFLISEGMLFHILTPS